MADTDLDPDIQSALDAISNGGTAPTHTGGGGVGALINSYTSKSPYAAQFKAAGLKYNIDPRVLEAIVQNESANPNNPYGNPKAIGQPVGQGPYKGQRALGLMQLLPDTARRLKVADPFDVNQNIDAAAHDLRDKLNATDIDDYSKALNAYSGGGGQPYQDKFSNAYKAIGGDPTALFNPAGPQPSAGAVKDTDPDLDPDLQGHFKALDADMQGIMGSTSDDPRAAIPVPGWGMLQQIGNAATFGMYPKILGALAAGQELIAGKSPSEIGQLYNNLTQGTEQARSQYETENKGHTLMANMLGETAGQAGLISTGEGLLKGIGGLAVDAVPALGKLAPVGRFLMGTAGRDAEGVSGVATRVASRIMGGGRIGAESGALQHGSEPNSGETLGQSTLRGMGTGMLTNTVLGPLVDDVKSPFRAQVNPGVAAAGKTLADAGVDIKGSQLVMKPGQALMGNVSHNQLGQFTAALAKDVDPAATDTVLGDSFFKDQNDRISKGIGSNTAGITYDQQGQTTLANIVGAAQKELDQDSPDLKQIVKTINRVDTEAGQNGMTLPPANYRALTQSDGAVTDLAQSRSSLTAKYGIQLRNALDDMATRTAQAAGPQGVQALNDLQTLRQQYKRLQILKGVTDPNTDMVNPQKLATAIKSNYPNYSTYGGSDSFVEKGRAGSLLPAPNMTAGLRQDSITKSSFTPIEKVLGLLGFSGEALSGLHDAIDVTHEYPLKTLASAGLAAGLFGARKIRDAVANSPAYRNYLMERAGVPGAKASALMHMMAGNQNMLIPAINSIRPGQTYLTPDGNPNQ